ncbi:hypothetical protein FACS1894199_04760 [Bacteroidia bacterium]|nr:hypothetical protein FACS1894199_04760 [Bacteroidia bacterium]
MVTLTFLSLFVFTNAKAYTNAEAGKREHTSSFDAANIKDLLISNKFGAVQIVQTTGNKIDVSVEISAVAKKMVDADILLEHILINETNSGTKLDIVTNIDKDITFDRMFKGLEVTINYKVSVPEGIRVYVLNEKGSVVVDKYKGYLNIDVKATELKLGILSGDLVVKQNEGLFTAEELDVLEGDFRDVTFVVKESANVKLEVHGGEFELKVAEKLYVSSSGGKMNLGDIEVMTGISSGTKFEVANIGQYLKMDMTTGELNVRNIHTNFTEVDIKSSYTKLGLSFMTGAGYELSLKHNKYAKLDIPADFKLTEQPTTEKGTFLKIGFVGDTHLKGKVSLNLKFGNMFIQ